MPTPPRLLRCERLEDRLTPAAAGDLDPAFGDGGRVVFPPDPELPQVVEPTAVAVQPDGRIVVAGSVFPNDIWAARFTADGQPDPTFGVDGKVAIGTGTVAAIALQPDGRIVLAGGTGDYSPDSDFAAHRLTADGQLDSTFGDGGTATVSFDAGGPMQDTAVAVAVLPDGRIILGGSTRTPSRPFLELSYDWTGGFAAARLTADGKLDPSFGDGGTATVRFPVGGYDAAGAASMGVQPDGRVVLAGSAVSHRTPFSSLHGPQYVNHTDFATIRLTAGGQLDSSFGDGGRVHLPFDLGGPTYDDSANAVAVRPDGAIMLAGTAHTPDGFLAVVARLTADGKLDPTYDGDGKAGTPGYSDAAEFMPDGRVVITGSELVRLTADGQPDPTFGTDGRAPTLFYNSSGGLAPRDLAVQPDGDILLASRRYSDGLLARVLGSPSPVPTTASPESVLAGGTPDGTARLLPSIGVPYRVSDAVPFFPGSGVTVRTAVADVTGDGIPDLIGGAGPGGGPHVRVLDGKTRAVVADFFAFEASFAGGVFVAAADLDGDGNAELVVTPDQGGGPVVAVFDGTGTSLKRFLGIDDPAFRGGARAALGEVNGDGAPDLIVSAGFGGGPRVALFDGAGLTGVSAPARLVPDFFVFEPTVRNGAFVGAGDLNDDGSADIAFGGGPGGGPRVRVIDGRKLLAAGPFAALDEVAGSVQLADFFAGDPALRGGARVTLKDPDGLHQGDELVVGSGENEPSRVRVYLAYLLTAAVAANPVQELDPFGAVLADGVFVG